MEEGGVPALGDGDFSGAGALEFSGFRLEPGRRRLFHHGLPVALGGRAFDLLCLLAESAGQVLSNNHLLDQVWHGKPVQDSNLRVQMLAVRRAIQGPPSQACRIMNVPGRGYLLTARVTRL